MYSLLRVSLYITNLNLNFGSSQMSEYKIGTERNTIDRTLHVVFSRFMCVSLTITLRQKSQGGLVGVEKFRESVLRRLCVTTLGFCHTRVIVIIDYTKCIGAEILLHKNLEKTTSNVLSVILINPWKPHFLLTNTEKFQTKFPK